MSVHKAEASVYDTGCPDAVCLPPLSPESRPSLAGEADDALRVALALVLNKRTNSVLMVERREVVGESRWALPGGKMHGNETAAAAAVREVREETGLCVSDDDWEVFACRKTNGVQIEYVLIHGDGDVGVQEKDKFTSVEWQKAFSVLQEVGSLLSGPVRTKIEEFVTYRDDSCGEPAPV